MPTHCKQHTELLDSFPLFQSAMVRLVRMEEHLMQEPVHVTVQMATVELPVQVSAF